MLYQLRNQANRELAVWNFVTRGHFESQRNTKICFCTSILAQMRGLSLRKLLRGSTLYLICHLQFKCIFYIYSYSFINPSRVYYEFAISPTFSWLDWLDRKGRGFESRSSVVFTVFIVFRAFCSQLLELRQLKTLPGSSFHLFCHPQFFFFFFFNMYFVYPYSFIHTPRLSFELTG